MPITDISLPEQVSMIRQPLRLGLTSNLPTERFPIKELRFSVNGTPTVGDTLQVAYGEVNETFTVQAVADGSGNTISQQGAMSLAEYAEQLANELRRNYALFLLFDIFAQSGSSEFVKLVPRSDKTGDFVFTDELTNIEVEALLSENPVYEDNPGLVVLVEKYDADSGEYSSPLLHDLPLISSQEEVFFDFQKDFDLRHHLPPVTTIGSAGDYFTLCTDNIQQYRIRYAERSGRPSQVQGLTLQEGVFFALYATNSFFKRYESFWSFWQSNGRFLTPYTGPRTVTHHQPEWLYWIGRESRNLSMRITIKKRSGTQVIFSRGTAGMELGKVWLLKTGFDQLNLPDDPEDPTVMYTVELTQEAVVVSEAITYYLSGDLSEYERYFVFGNSLGGCDTVRATGKFIARLARTVQQAQRIVTPAVLAEGRGQDFSYQVRGRGSYEGSVGYKSAAYVAYLEDLLESPEAWIVDPMSRLFTPIQIDAGNYDIIKDGDDLFTLRFSYTHAWDEQGIGISDTGQRFQLPPPNPDQNENTGG